MLRKQLLHYLEMTLKVIIVVKVGVNFSSFQSSWHGFCIINLFLHQKQVLMSERLEMAGFDFSPDSLKSTGR